MSKAVFRSLVLAAALSSVGAVAADRIVIIGNANLHQLDKITIARIYAGKVIESEGIAITAVNAASGSAVRSRFLRTYLDQDEDKYTAYWTVRRYIGKGASPRELPRSIDVINFVNATPGAIGYIDEVDVQPGLNVLSR